MNLYNIVTRSDLNGHCLEELRIVQVKISEMTGDGEQGYTLKLDEKYAMELATASMIAVTDDTTADQTVLLTQSLLFDGNTFDYSTVQWLGGQTLMVYLLKVDASNLVATLNLTNISIPTGGGGDM